MAWNDSFVYRTTKITSAQLNAIIAKIQAIIETDLSLSDNTTNDTSTDKHGFMPKLPGGTAFWRADGQWAVTGAGDISGSTGSTDEAIIMADGTGGATFQASAATVTSAGTINIPTGEEYQINGTALAASDVGALPSTTVITDLTGTLGVANGGTGATTLADGGLLVGNVQGAIEVVAAGATTDILVGGGANTKPAWGTDIPTAVTIGTKYIYRAEGTDVPITDGGTGISTYPKRTIFLSGAGGVASTTAGCGAFETFETSSNDVNFRSTIFAAGATDISKEWGFVLPLNYNGSTITATPIFHVKAGTDASNHTVIWNVAGVCFADGETLDTAYGSAQTSTTTFASSLAGKMIVGATTSAITLGGASPAGGEWCQIRVSREGDDTNTDTAYLLGVKLVYQTNGTSDE